MRSQKTTYWQALGTKGESSVFEIADPAARQAEINRRVQLDDSSHNNGQSCPAGMVRVQGAHQSREEVIRLQHKACLDPNWNPKYLCTKFAASKLAEPAKKTTPLDYCVDRYEFPNIPGEYPAVLLSWNDAKALCEAQGKRLCTEDEWVFACEGPRAQPYPYGYDRYTDPRSRFPDNVIQGDGCNIDIIRKGFKVNAAKFLKDKKSAAAMIEIDRLWAGVKSGSRKQCVSPFGVYDITGNIEEWTMATGPTPRGFKSVLRGGYWMPVESRCQPGNYFHGPGHAFYQTGFRCCAN